MVVNVKMQILIIPCFGKMKRSNITLTMKFLCLKKFEKKSELAKNH